MNRKALKEERISIRATHDIKTMIAKAATISKTSVSDFLLKAACKEAKQVLEEHDQITLSNQQRDWFLALLDQPFQVNAKLEQAIKRQHKHLHL